MAANHNAHLLRHFQKTSGKRLNGTSNQFHAVAGNEVKKTEYKKKINGIDCINDYDDFVKQSNDYLKKISEGFYNKYFQKYEK